MTNHYVVERFISDELKRAEWLDSWTSRLFIVRQSDGVTVAAIPHHFELYEEEQRLARLLAASPRMLEILETIENENNVVPDWLWRQIQEVVAEARGLAK